MPYTVVYSDTMAGTGGGQTAGAHTPVGSPTAFVWEDAATGFAGNARFKTIGLQSVSVPDGVFVNSSTSLTGQVRVRATFSESAGGDFSGTAAIGGFMDDHLGVDAVLFTGYRWQIGGDEEDGFEISIIKNGSAIGSIESTTAPTGLFEMELIIYEDGTLEGYIDSVLLMTRTDPGTLLTSGWAGVYQFGDLKSVFFDYSTFFEGEGCDDPPEQDVITADGDASALPVFTFDPAWPAK